MQRCFAVLLTDMAKIFSLAGVVDPNGSMDGSFSSCFLSLVSLVSGFSFYSCAR